ncbi:DNA repair protein rhp57 [Coemansia nantahalensis]|uniref:DNA repair protein rhp57 n=2 Tax=Coemansia TaxID=4863 RepID=A0ACC1KYE3_9FUNG|nr:DNA repair protein rhp57 [Coemansia nantahalensis]KAJ2797314.1 DNA repair protein rhp57 [Coemansia helicoidea]
MPPLSAEDRALVAKCVAKVGCDEAHKCLLMPFAKFAHATGLDEAQARRAWGLLGDMAYPWKDRLAAVPELLAREQWITTGDAQLDRLLGGGIRLGSIVEVVGESATGKSQLCLQLAIAAQLPESVGGADGDVVYISTEGAFPAQRLASMIGPFVERVCGGRCAVGRLADVGEVLRRIQVAELEDMETMFHALGYKVPALLSSGRVRLVIVDSIAAHLRFNMDGDTFDNPRQFYKERSSQLMQMGAKFKRWADEYRCAFVCTNQVTDIIGDPGAGGAEVRPLAPAHLDRASESGSGLSQADSGGEFAAMSHSRKAPALGAVWANTINVRVMMYQRRGLAQSDVILAHHGSGTPEQHAVAPPRHLLRTRRWLENSLSPWAPRAQCEVVLDDSGFRHMPAEQPGDYDGPEAP